MTSKNKISNGVKDFIYKIWLGIISVGLTLPFLTRADGVGDTCPEGTLCNPLKTGSFPALVESIAKLVAQVGIPIAAIFIIYSGLLFVTARGNEEQLRKAKTNFMWAMIGTAILLGAWVIARAINETITGLGE